MLERIKNLNEKKAALNRAVKEKLEPAYQQKLVELNQALADMRTNKGEEKGEDPNKFYQDRITFITQDMNEMKTLCNALIQELEVLLNNPTIPDYEIKLYNDTMDHLIAVASHPFDLKKIDTLKDHALWTCGELLQNKDTALTDKMRDHKLRFYSKIAMLAGLAVLVIGGIALAIGLAVPTLGVSLVGGLVLGGALTMGGGGLSALIGGNVLLATYNPSPTTKQDSREKLADHAKRAAEQSNELFNMFKAPKDSSKKSSEVEMQAGINSRKRRG